LRLRKTGVAKLNRQVTTAVAGFTALLAGIGLYVVFIGIALNYYDERSGPWWLVSLWFLALALAIGGLITVLLAALGVPRALRTRRRRRAVG
jgi:uncharacterized membrane protein